MLVVLSSSTLIYIYSIYSISGESCVELLTLSWPGVIHKYNEIIFEGEKNTNRAASARCQTTADVCVSIVYLLVVQGVVILLTCVK